MKTFKRETVGGEEVDKKLGNIGGEDVGMGEEPTYHSFSGMKP